MADKEISLGMVSVTAELDNMGWPWEPAGGDGTEIKCKCPNPAHGDEHPSCGINIEKKVFRCPVCNASGDFISFMALALRTVRRVVVELLAERYGAVMGKAIDVEAVERWHSAIWTSGPMLLELRKRMVSDDVIRERRLGFDGKRITIPVKNDRGQFVNVRKYLPGAPGAEKMKDLRGHGGLHIYPVDQLSYDTLIVAGGEIKAVVTAEKMNPHGIGVVTATSGEGNWEPHLSRKLRGKRVFVIMDVDEAGLSGSRRVGSRIRPEARWTGITRLDIDPEVHPKGDLNDYWAEGRSADDLLKLLDATEEWIPPAQRDEDDAQPTDIPLVHLSLSTEAARSGKRLRVLGVVTAKDDSPYIVPKVVTCTCSRNQVFCHECPVMTLPVPPDGGGVDLEIKADSPAILQMIDAPKRAQRDVVRDALKMPKCKVVEFRAKEKYNVEDLRLTPQLEISSRHGDSVTRPAYYVGHGIETNAGYEFEGRVYAHPKDQHAVFIASKATASRDSLQSYDPTDSELEELAIFKPDEWSPEGIQAKLDDLYSDYEANVTRIYQRRDLHLATDLGFHSPLILSFDEREVKGWTEVLIMGDSGQGKTECVQGLGKHYNVGEWVSCKNASPAGLLGGLEQLGTRWFIQWGVIPTHDKRLVILEELKGASHEVISKLTDMRSSGVALIDKIEKRKTHARTRLIGLSNTRSGRALSDFSFGVEAVVELVGALEDVRRFDFVYLVASSQVDPDFINRAIKDRPQVVHRHTAELSRRVVMWAWTRTADQIIFTAESTKCILDSANELCEKYTDAVPIVDRGSMRLKLARLSAALAARTFSSANEDNCKIVVRPCHAQYIASFLDRIYSSSVFGYHDFTRAIKSADAIIQPEMVQQKIMGVPFVGDFIESILSTGEIELRDICDWTGWEFEQGRELMSFLVRKRAIVREKNSYRKTRNFIRMLKEMRDSKAVRENDRPDWIKDIDITKRDM
jgi:hypothetical protein